MAKSVNFKEVESKDYKRAKRLLKKKRKTLRIGVLEKDAVVKHPEHYDATFGEIAVWNEYGTDGPAGIPARSWLNGYLADNLEKIKKKLAADTLRVLFAGEDERQALNNRGHEMTRAIVRRIKQRIPPPNSPYTLRRKRGSIPLIDSGEFIKRIKHEVKD
jgi:hypothetical protein